MLGRVRHYNSVKGFGFIRPDDGGKEDSFVHVTALHRAGLEELNAGDLLEYEIEHDERSGKMRACNIRLVSRGAAPAMRSRVFES